MLRTRIWTGSRIWPRSNPSNPDFGNFLSQILDFGFLRFIPRLEKPKIFWKNDLGVRHLKVKSKGLLDHNQMKPYRWNGAEILCFVYHNHVQGHNLWYGKLVKSYCSLLFHRYSAVLLFYVMQYFAMVHFWIAHLEIADWWILFFGSDFFGFKFVVTSMFGLAGGKRKWNANLVSAVTCIWNGWNGILATLIFNGIDFL